MSPRMIGDDSDGKKPLEEKAFILLHSGRIEMKQNISDMFTHLTACKTHGLN